MPVPKKNLLTDIAKMGVKKAVAKKAAKTARMKEVKKETKQIRKTNKLNKKKALAPKPKVTLRPNAADQSFKRDEILALRAAHMREINKKKK